MTQDPHKDGAVHHLGAPLGEAAGAVVLLHGRGGSAEDILSLAQALYRPGIAYLAPQAAGRTWYPHSFMAPREENEPFVTSALAKVEAVVSSTGLPREKVLLCGFSQGACLSTEFVASHPARYAGLIAFTGGLLGPEGTDLRHEGELAGTPVFMGSGDPDAHVPWARVQASADELRRMGALVTARRYPGRPHTIGAEEIDFARRLVEEAFPR